MTEDQFNQIQKRKGYGVISDSRSKLKPLKSDLKDSREMRDVESSPRAEPLAEERVAISYTGRPVVRFKVFRRRLADYASANCDKYYIDSLRYAMLIRDDSEKDIRFIHEGQQKVESDAEERVEINIEYESVDLNNLWVPLKKK